MPTILLVDDDPDVARTLETALRRDHVVYVANSGVQALQLARQIRPDLVILDISMPGMDGLEVCRRLRADPILNRTPILFLTALGGTEERIEGFKVGADDYMAKPFSLQELQLRIQAVFRRTRAPEVDPDAPAQMVVGDIVLDSRTHGVEVAGRPVQLTPIEYELLYHFMVHAGEVYSTHELLQEVWDYPTDTGSPDLVRMHVRNLRAKVEDDPRSPTRLVTVPRHGYRLNV